MDFEELIKKRGYFLIDITAQEVPHEQIQTKHNAVALCDRGEAVLEVNMQRVRITQGTQLMAAHVLLRRTVSISSDFHAQVLVVSDRFWIDVCVGIPTKIIEAALSKTCRQITDPKAWTILNNFFQNIRLYDDMSYSAHSIEWAGAIFRCMIIAAAEMELHERNGQTTYPSSYTMGDTYFRKFVTLLDENVVKEHEVTFYAEQLHITPKYLSEICKQQTNHKAKEIISTFLFSKIKRDIVLTGKSMKVLAYEYGFADQSSLGKFFRKMSGESPSMYKKKNGLNTVEEAE